MDEVGIETARANLGEIVDRARLAGQVTQINRNGKPAAVIVPVDQWLDMKAELGMGPCVAPAGCANGPLPHATESTCREDRS